LGLAEIFVASAILPSVGAFARDNVMSDESKQNGEPTSHHSWFQPLDRHPTETCHSGRGSEPFDAANQDTQENCVATQQALPSSTPPCC
jgi:hypothetical protein